MANLTIAGSRVRANRYGLILEVVYRNPPVYWLSNGSTKKAYKSLDEIFDAMTAYSSTGRFI